MKKVRFETPTKLVMDIAQEYECHSPRPFLDRQNVNISYNINQGRRVFSNDPVDRFENDNSLPYPIANKTLDVVRELENKKVPSSDLDLSMLDCPKSAERILTPRVNTVSKTESNGFAINSTALGSHKILASIENTSTGMRPSIQRHNDFFLKRENIGKISVDPMQHHFQKIFLDNEQNPLRKKTELMRLGTHTTDKENNTPRAATNTPCNCHHCLKVITNGSCDVVQNTNRTMEHLHSYLPTINCNMHNCVPMPAKCSCNCNMHIVQPPCNCSVPQPSPLSPKNAIDKKTWAIEKYEKSRESSEMSSEVEKSNTVFKEKREPTVSDLFKIIKLQNEQLQLLQEKVDKFISTRSNEIQDKKVPIQNYVTEQLAVQTVNSEQHKISIGVMTSFEMVRTSTVINKEIINQCEAQIQCNRSQISIKEVISKKQTGNLNFLEGISPVSKNTDQMEGDRGQISLINESCHAENIIEDKTLNELSLYNVQVDNATTPLMSPEQSLYLDIRDYSESDSGSDDQSNVGWTYYNKVMTHVNGMLQDSDMPSSASALYRHTKQRCMQMDKSNISVGKRVTFGDDPLKVQQQHISPTDTSLKMNQLAAKYLKNAPASHTPSPRSTDEMSFATRKYMERHKLLHGQNAPMPQDIPRFLDITALKQQPKFI